MRRFLEICSELHLDDRAHRATRLRNGIAANLQDAVLFFICGHDFIFDPSDRKFDAIFQLFIRPGGPFVLNLYPKCLTAIARTLNLPDVAVHIEGTPEEGPGKWSHEITHFVHRGGASAARSAANYNLQTRAIELVVTHDDGLEYQGVLDQTIRDLKEAFQSGRTGFMVEETVDEMRQRLAPLWPTPINRLGL